MPELIIAISLLGVISISIWVYINYKQNKIYQTKAIELLNQYGNVFDENKKVLFNTENQTFEILFYKIQKDHELTINSKYIWEIHMKNRSTLINQTSFLSSDYPKIIIVYPIETKIKRYINENEMVFIDYKDEFNNMRIVKFHQLEDFLGEVIK